jgi:hypothetical protein
VNDLLHFGLLLIVLLAIFCAAGVLAIAAIRVAARPRRRRASGRRKRSEPSGRDGIRACQ